MQTYAVVKTGGKQYTVSAGDVIRVELLGDHQTGDEVELTTLAASSGGELKLGEPELESKVKATIMDEGRGKKVIVFKRRKRKGFRKRNGHRQSFHAIRIDSVPGN